MTTFQSMILLFISINDIKYMYQKKKKLGWQILISDIVRIGLWLYMVFSICIFFKFCIDLKIDPENRIVLVVIFFCQIFFRRTSPHTLIIARKENFLHHKRHVYRLK